MSENLLIGKDHLFCTCKALQKHAPHLLPKMAMIVTKRPVVNFLNRRAGVSASDQYAMPLGIEDVTAILNALVEIKKTHGYKIKFHTMQVNFLIVVWEEHLKHLQSKPGNKISNA